MHGLPTTNLRKQLSRHNISEKARTKTHLLAQPKWAPWMLGNHRDAEATADPLWYNLAVSVFLPKRQAN